MPSGAFFFTWSVLGVPPTPRPTPCPPPAPCPRAKRLVASILGWRPIDGRDRLLNFGPAWPSIGWFILIVKRLVASILGCRPIGGKDCLLQFGPAWPTLSPPPIFFNPAPKKKKIDRQKTNTKMLPPLKIFFFGSTPKKIGLKKEEKEIYIYIWYGCFYLHCSRDSVSPVCRDFLCWESTKKTLQLLLVQTWIGFVCWFVSANSHTCNNIFITFLCVCCCLLMTFDWLMDNYCPHCFIKVFITIHMQQINKVCEFYMIYGDKKPYIKVHIGGWFYVKTSRKKFKVKKKYFYEKIWKNIGYSGWLFLFLASILFFG